MMPREEQLTDWAYRHLGIETLRERRSDSLDFHTVSVWGVRAALLEAYRQGFTDAQAGRVET